MVITLLLFFPILDYSMRLDKHWGRHNLKMYEKQQKAPTRKIDTKQILKQRKIKEKRRALNLKNRKKKGKSKMKKSAKFNKV